jgi:TDG/mug DNA glycosylase family protein
MIRTGLPAVVDGRTRVLVLGSLPGERSLAMAQYYAHPQNQFWRLIRAVTGADLTGAPYEQRLARLLEAGVGLWDVIGSATRRGSLDAAIRDAAPNALADFAAGLPALRAIGFNGGKAAALGRQQLGETPGLALIDLPSSSPAHTVPFDAKRARWMHLQPFLHPPG